MITRAEQRWLLWVGLGLLGLTTLPYLLGYVIQGSSWRFAGFVFGIEDGNSYIAKMLWGAEGAWLFRTPYTAYPQSGFIAFLPYLLLGKLTAPPAQHEQLIALFQLFRWVGGMAMIWATYQFTALFVAEINIRRWATLIILAGGGLGWLSIFGFQSLWSNGLPLEFYSPETFGFLSLFGLPHLALGRALMLWGLTGYLKAGAQDPKGFRPAFLLGGLWLMMGLLQPLTVVTGWAILAAHLVGYTGVGLFHRSRQAEFDWRRWSSFLKTAVGMVGVSSPIVIYTLISFSTDPFLREWSRQNLILSPPPGDYLLGFATMLPFIIYGLGKVTRQFQPILILLVGWVALFPLLAYAPYNLQRRLPDGIWVALVILSMFGFLRIKSRVMGVLSKIWLGSSFLPVFFLWLGGLTAVMTVQTPLFRPSQEVEVFLFLQSHAPADAVVLTDYETANALPAWAPVRTLIGHGPESMRLDQVRPMVEDFLAGRLDWSAQVRLIEQFKIDYILLTPQTSEFRPTWGLVDDHYKIIYDRDGYMVLEILGLN